MALLLGCGLTMVSCSKPWDADSAPTPHPATESRRMAVTAYPALAIPGSEFNRTFLELYEEQKKHDPTALAVETWPMDLAHATAEVITTRHLTPTPKPYQPTDLDKGATHVRRHRSLTE